MQIAVAEAKAQFAELIRCAQTGEEIELTRYDRPVARLVVAPFRPNRLIACAKGTFTLSPDVHDGDAEVAALLRGCMPVTWAQGQAVRGLPPHHGDPFETGC